MLRILTLVLVSLVLQSQHPLEAKDLLDGIIKRGKLRIGTEVGYMPFEMRSKKGKVIGFDIDLAKLLARELGVKLEIVNTEWDGIIPALLTGKFDLLVGGMTITAKRNLKVNFANPYIVIGQSILIKKSHIGKIKGYRDLNNKKYRVVSKMGTTGEQAIKKLLPKAQYKGYQTSDDAVLEVINGRADAFIYDMPYNSVFARTKGKDKIHHLDTPFTYEPLAWAVRRGDINILNWLNNILRQVKNDGRYDKIHAKWFQSEKWLKHVQ